MKSFHPTWVVLLFALSTSANLSAQPKVEPKADPAASKLLAEARATRAVWDKFPGFTADIEVVINGKGSRGQLHVAANGRVRSEKLSKEAEAWANPLLGSITGHRLDDGDLNTPCVFADKEENHPLGRAVRVLGDGMHSSFRIRDKQIMVVDRRQKDRRFTISVLENRTNAEGKILPRSYVVNHWDLITGNLVKTDASFQEWTRIGHFDLPMAARAVSAAKGVSKVHSLGELGPDAYVVRSLTLSNHKLLEPTSK